MSRFLIGPTLGFGLWLLNLSTVENIVHRPDANGSLQFAPQNVIEYLKLPFDPEKKEVAWATAPGITVRDRLKLLSLNWVVVTGVTTALCCAIK